MPAQGDRYRQVYLGSWQEKSGVWFHSSLSWSQLHGQRDDTVPALSLAQPPQHPAHVRETSSCVLIVWHWCARKWSSLCWELILTRSNQLIHAWYVPYASLYLDWWHNMYYVQHTQEPVSGAYDIVHCIGQVYAWNALTNQERFHWPSKCHSFCWKCTSHPPEGSRNSYSQPNLQLWSTHTTMLTRSLTYSYEVQPCSHVA